MEQTPTAEWRGSSYSSMGGLWLERSVPSQVPGVTLAINIKPPICFNSAQQLVILLPQTDILMQITCKSVTFHRNRSIISQLYILGESKMASGCDLVKGRLG